MVKIPVYFDQPVRTQEEPYKDQRGHVYRIRRIYDAAGVNTLRITGRGLYIYRIHRIVVYFTAIDGAARTLTVQHYTTETGSLGTTDVITQTQTTGAGGGAAIWILSPDTDYSTFGTLATTLRQTLWIEPFIRSNEYMNISLTLTGGGNDGGYIDVEYEETEFS